MHEILNYLETHTVFKALIVTGSDTDAVDLAQTLTSYGYDALFVVDDIIKDDRMSYMALFRMYASQSVRYFCLCHSIMQQVATDVEQYLMDHDLLVLYQMQSHSCHKILEWVHDAHRRGFTGTSANHTVIIYDEDENFLMHNVEKGQ